MDRLSPLLIEDDPERTLEWTLDVPEGVRVSTMTAQQARDNAVSAPLDRVAAIAALRSTRPALLEIPAGAVIDRPIIIDGAGRGENAVGGMVVKVGANAQVTIISRYSGSGTYAAKTDVHVGDGAHVNMVSLQDWDDDAVHAAQTSYLIGRDAQVQSVEVSLGGSLVRLNSSASFAGPGGSVAHYGLYFADAGQHLEHRQFVDHDAPNTHSIVDYRGALQGEGAHSVWVGDVLIRKNAEGISTYEQNRNLVLTDGCIADSVPNLEIETGEIAGAGHSSTTGRFDDSQLFYLMSRGIPEEEAKRLIVEGFFFEIIRRIGVADIETRLLDAVRAELATQSVSDTETQER